MGQNLHIFFDPIDNTLLPSQSSSILGKMMWRAQQNKLVLAAVGIVVLLVVAYTIYHLATT